MCFLCKEGKIASSSSSIVALKKDGTVVCFGGGSFVIPSMKSVNTITGLISPEFCEPSGKSPLKEGFKVEIIGTDISTVTNPDGTFEILNVPENFNRYAIRISKPGFLYREIKNFTENIDIGSVTASIDLWAGDINQDNSINITDIMEIVSAYNTDSTNEKYKRDCDINGDDSVNITDIMIVVKHFNQNTDSYPDALS